jgi:hypothetical protein
MLRRVVCLLAHFVRKRDVEAILLSYIAASKRHACPTSRRRSDTPVLHRGEMQGGHIR